MRAGGAAGLPEAVAVALGVADADALGRAEVVGDGLATATSPGRDCRPTTMTIASNTTATTAIQVFRALTSTPLHPARWLPGGARQRDQAVIRPYPLRASAARAARLRRHRGSGRGSPGRCACRPRGRTRRSGPRSGP